MWLPEEDLEAGDNPSRQKAGVQEAFLVQTVVQAKWQKGQERAKHTLEANNAMRGKEHTGPLLPIVHVPISHPWDANKPSCVPPGILIQEGSGSLQVQVHHDDMRSSRKEACWEDWQERKPSTAPKHRLPGRGITQTSTMQLPWSDYTWECDSHIADPRPTGSNITWKFVRNTKFSKSTSNLQAETWGGSSNGCFHKPSTDWSACSESKELLLWVQVNNDMLLKPNPHHLQSKPNSCYCCYCYYCLLFSPSFLHHIGDGLQTSMYLKKSFICFISH